MNKRLIDVNEDGNIDLSGYDAQGLAELKRRIELCQEIYQEHQKRPCEPIPQHKKD